MKNLLKSINEDNGKKISDLESALIVLYKLISDKLEDKPKAGVTLAKEKKNEKKVRYAKVKKDLNSLINYLAAKGAFSIGVCETCTNFDQKSTANPDYGVCKRSREHCHRWDTCKDHSKRGGGYGV